jgi:hypothetical protein
VLGDDALRERRLAVGVLAATQVTTLKIEVLKFMSCMDPLTLRLFGRLQQQQPPAQQRLIQVSRNTWVMSHNVHLQCWGSYGMHQEGCSKCAA